MTLRPKATGSPCRNRTSMLPRYPLSNWRDAGTNAAQSLRTFQMNHGSEPSTANPNGTRARRTSERTLDREPDQPGHDEVEDLRAGPPADAAEEAEHDPVPPTLRTDPPAAAPRAGTRARGSCTPSRSRAPSSRATRSRSARPRTRDRRSVAPGSPIVRRPSRQTSSAEIALMAIGTALSVAVEDPNTANTPAMTIAVSEPP